MRAKLAGFIVLGAGALFLAACGGGSSEAPEDHGAAPAEATAPTAEDAAKEAAIAADAPPEAPAEDAATPAVTPGETPPPPEPTKSENIFY